MASKYIEVISEIVPKNNRNFAIADVNDLRGGYIQVNTIDEMNSFLATNKLKEGMLCYVKKVSSDNHFYQYLGGVWTEWIVQGGSGGGSGVKVVDKISDLESEELKLKGQIVFVNELDDLRYYDGALWKSFTRIYIQSTPPDDVGGIWIDTSIDSKFINSEEIIQNLIGVINILTQRVKKLEYAFNSEIDLGDFSNNKVYNAYAGAEGIEPDFSGTSEEEDNRIQQENLISGVYESEPSFKEYQTPNATSIRIKSGTYSEMIAHKDDFQTRELLWCYDLKQLWIKDPKTYKLIKIGSEGGNPDPEPDPDIMEGILTELIGSKNKIVGIEFADMANKDNTYLIRVNNGHLDIHDYRLDKNLLAGNSQVIGNNGYYSTLYFPVSANNVGSIDSPKIYINSVYCGADSGTLDYNPVSHNFIELSNLSNSDLNLKGLYLHYTERGTRDWVSLPLQGTIKAKSTFLIRGAQCSVRDVNTTLIKVDSYDIDWTKDITYNNSRLEISSAPGVEPHSIWDSINRIKFSYDCAFYLSSEETIDYYKDNVLNSSSLLTADGCAKWYVDLVGIGTYNNISMPCEKTAFPTRGSNVLLNRYYNMDPVKQATKAMSARDNSKDWTYINLSKIPPQINIDNYIPKASFENKNIFFNKSKLKPGAPNIITCTLGHNSHTTRCFNWVSVGYYDEYIKIWQDGETPSVYESFKAGDGRTSNKNWNNSIYNRIRSITTDGTAFTVHKFIIDLPEPTTTKVYKYQVGREGAWSEERSFTLRSKASVIANGFNYLQISDQQGFNKEEYETWRVSAEFIANDIENPYHFSINTGDATQNGNRMNEWIDYFEAGDSIFKNTEQMYTVGNNDLCPLDVYTLGDGEDPSKVNPINIEYFFTFEHPYEIPVSASGKYIPCTYSFIYGNTYFLCANSEITDTARTSIFGDSGSTNVYNNIKQWYTSDITNTTIPYTTKVAFCHESPFTIITADLILKYIKRNAGGYIKDPNTKRGGSHLNTVGNYWFSQFLQDNQFKLCMCGHKHTYSNSRYLREDPTKTMEPIVYDASANPTWYSTLPEREKMLCQLSSDSALSYVKYVMCQATGYKLISNKELPAQNIPWLLEYYPVVSQVEDASGGVVVKVNTSQQYPNYIIWNIGTGTETEDPTTTVNNRSRILGKSFKLLKKDDNKIWAYNYNVPLKYTDLRKVGGNGSINPNNNIIVEYTF